MTRGEWQDWTYCIACQKRRYRTKKAARQAIRVTPGQRMSAYPCTATGGFHIGHLPRRVLRGEVTRGEHYAAQAA